MTVLNNPYARNIYMWQRARTWNEEPKLMELREAWIERQIGIVDTIVNTFPNGHVSVPEWRATIAEASFDSGAYRRCSLPNGPQCYWAVHQMRQTWAEEAMLFFTIGQPIEEVFDPMAHSEAMLRHQEERISWRPHHRIPGNPTGQYAPVHEEGLTHRWWEGRGSMYRQLARQSVITSLLAQNEALAQVFADDPSMNVPQARHWLVSEQRFGWPLLRNDDRVHIPEDQDHFERGVFAMMRGYVGELQVFTDRGIPITAHYNPSEMETLYHATNEPYHTPYLTRGSPGW